MDTLRKIQSLNSDPVPPAGNPRQESMRHIHQVLNQGGGTAGVTVGHAVAAAIEGIRYGAGEHGAREVDTVFKDPSLTNAYLTPLNSPYAEQAHRQIAQAEFNYWSREAAQNPSAATQAALSFGVGERVQLQKRIGQLVEMGSSFTQNLANEQNPSNGAGNSVAQYANMYLPSGPAQPNAGRTSDNAAPWKPPTAPGPSTRRR
ncbi:hypothetical protein ACIF80_17930 [Streptomyces sp. NPDC085927]|uniref:hypothetical protein n=1 Tax=Streptomyces sp. NPDC085927 TaxID=3365738 RepID=UPI0037CFD5AF